MNSTLIKLAGRLVVIFTVISLLMNANCSAQQKNDTLAIARKLRNDKKFYASIDLLKLYISHHPKNLDANLLLAQTLYWDKQVKASELAYEKTIMENPGNYYLKLDYAKMLVELGEIDKAQPLLNTYLTYDAISADALIALAKIAYIKKDYNLALSYTNQALNNNPTLLGTFLFGSIKK